MAERVVMSLSGDDALALANAILAASGASRGEVQVFVEHWPSERTSVAVKGPRTWGPPIPVAEYRFERDETISEQRERDYAAEMERHRYAAGKRCESGPRDAA